MELSTPTLSKRLTGIATRFALGFLLVLILLGWWAFANPPQFTPSGSESWSKGVYTGVASLNQAMALQVDRDGGYLIWVDDANRLHFATVDHQGVIKSDKFLEIATLFPRSPQLILRPDNVLHLAWLDGRGTQQLYYAQIDGIGTILAEPVTISQAEETVSAFQMAFNADDQAEIFWGNEAGLFHTTLDSEGQQLASPSLLWPDGDRPSLQVDKAGLFHLAFAEPFGSLNHHIYYATFDPAAKSLSQPSQIVDTFRRGGQILEGPALGLDNENVYLFWSVIDSRDVTSFSFYSSFPIDDPQPAPATNLNITGGAFPSGIWPLDGQRSQMIAAVSSQLFARGEREFQTLTAVFTGGAYQGHQLISASRNPSLKPALAADKDGNLHALWLDAGRLQQHKVVYANTVPAMREALAGITLHDIIDNIFGALLGLIFIAGILPFLIVWAVLPLVIILVYFFATGQDTLAERRTWIVLAVAFLSQIVIMILLSPDNQFLSAFWRFALPLLLALPPILTLHLLISRLKLRGLFPAFFLLILSHGLLRLITVALIFSGQS